MKKMLLVMIILVGVVFAQSESRTGTAPAATEVIETTTINETGAPAEGEAAQTCMGGGGIMSFLPMIAIIAIFYFLMIRPQQKQAKMLKQMRSELKRDDKVITSGGIHGIITNIKSDDVVTVKIADGVKIDVDRNSLQMEGPSQNQCGTCK